ncbi:hypothetical protein [Streptomyces sp. URMC 125]|uniref:hypothetical protein n=1 Tax=Streptomyces sp. URMC 125 TaxID=3423419 RepID=UPI003F1E02E2
MQVVHVIRHYPEEFEADLLEFFGVDLLDVWRHRLTFRRLSVLLNSLMKKPGKSTLLAEINEKAVWTDESYLLARVSDGMEMLNYLVLSAFSSNANGIDPPKPIPRPGQEEPQEEKKSYEYASPDEVVQFFARFGS